MRKWQSRRVVNGTWYEVCVQQAGEIRDVIEASSRFDAETRADSLAGQWPDCEMIFVRQHTLDPVNGPGASRYHVIYRLDFRQAVANA